MTSDDRPLVSVIIPAYNAARFIAEAIESVWRQGVDDLEVIVVDDGSSDDTAEILAGPVGEGVQVVTTANQGVAKARNEGLDRATGEFIAFLDADDRWRPTKLRRELALMAAEPEVGIVFSNFVRFDTRTGEVSVDNFQYSPELESLRVAPTAGGDGWRILDPAFPALVGFQEVPGFTPTMLFRRTAIEGLRFRYPLEWTGEYRYLEDMDFCLRCYRRAPVAFIRDPLVEVRRHGENLTSKSNYLRLPWAKLTTLIALAEDDLEPGEAAALNRRIGGQWASVGRIEAQSRSVPGALRAFLRAASHGRWKPAIGGLVRMPVDLIRGRVE